MRRLTFLVGLVIVVSVLAHASECDVNAYFVSPFVDQVVEDQIISALDNAHSQILIAMYSFTDDQIGDAVIRAEERGVEVYVLVDDGQDSDAQGREYPKLWAAGIPVGVEHYSGLLHHKFAVIDNSLVITGSYNWTESANESNFENAVFIYCSEIAEKYVEEFNYIANGLLGLGWEIFDGNGGPSVPFPSCEECLARINSATQGQFDAVYGIGEVLSERLIAAQPFSVYSCSRATILAALDAVDGIGSVKANAIVEYFCPELEE